MIEAIDKARSAVGLIFASTAAFVREHRRKTWADHQCPKCGAGVSRLILLSGYCNKLGVRATLRCRDCGSRHMIKGESTDTRTIFLETKKNARAYKRWAM